MNLTTFKTLVIREYWENKSLKLAPLIIASVLIFALVVGLITGQTLISTHGLENTTELGFAEINNASQEELGKAMQAFQYAFVFGPLLVGLLFVLFFYSLGSLYNDRRDRSILFWKSMPVSDLQTVMSKVFTAFIVAPVLTAAIAFIAQFVGLVLLTLMVWFNGGSAWSLIWSNSALFSVLFNDFAIAIMVGLWMAPILGWLWLVSAFAKRVAFLIAIFVPLGIMMVEGMILHSSHFAELVGRHFAQVEHIVTGTYKQGHPFTILSQGGFWIGLVICALFIAAATYIRRFRDDSY